MKKIKTILLNSCVLPKLFALLFAISYSVYSYAELEELDDKKLEEQTGKEGVTIDLSFKLSIGEIYIDHFERDQDGKQNTLLTSPPPRIEYHHGKN